jgi:hypothetical protein
MNLSIKNRDFFLKYFLQPISKVSDSCCVVLNESKLSSVVSSPDNAIILNVKYTLDQPVSTNDDIILNIPDIKKLIRALDVIEDESINLIIDKNNLSYKNNNIAFKYHLLENGVINRPKINVEKINSFKIDTKFSLSDKSLNEIIKASTFSVDSNKAYFYTDSNKVHVELTDRTRPNMDSFSTEASPEYSGSEISSICLNLEIIRILSSNKVKQINCKVNTELGIVIFEHGNNILSTQFIVSSLTK